MRLLLFSMTLHSLVARGEGFSYNPSVVVQPPPPGFQHHYHTLPTTTNFHHQHNELASIRHRKGISTTLRESSASAAVTSDDDGDQDAPVVSGKGTANISDEIFNLVKGIVGAGVLTLPSGIAAFGSAPSAAIPAIILIAFIGVLSAYGFLLIGRACYITKTTSYRDAWSASVSRGTSWIPAWSVTLKTMFATLAYSMILRDTFTSLILAAGYNVSRELVLLTVTTTVLLPLCLLKNLSSLAPFSLLGSLGMIYTAIAMIVRYADKSYKVGGRFVADLPETLQPSFGTVGASGVMSSSSSILLGMLGTAYMAHFNAPKFYIELKNNTIPRFMTVIASSFSVSFAIFAVMAGVGFLTFGSNCAGLILSNYSPRDTLIGFSKFAVAMSLVFSYPLAFVGFRDGLFDLMQIKKKNETLLNSFTVGVLAAVTLAALALEDVSLVLAFAGATLGNALIYVYPALMFRGAVKKLANPTKLQNFEVGAALTSALAGVGMGAVGVYSLLKM